jgi:hypothetical protein
MKGSSVRNWITAGLAATLLGGCVTINIYFPAAEAQKAADKIIDEVWQLKDGQNGQNGAGPQPAPPAQQGEGKK